MDITCPDGYEEALLISNDGREFPICIPSKSDVETQTTMTLVWRSTN